MQTVVEPYPRETEDLKYSKLYEQEYGEDPGNHSIKVRLTNWSNIRLAHPEPTVIDYGCGRGQLVKFVKHKHYHGIDLSIVVIGKNKTADNISFQHGMITDCEERADVGYNIDVMEHIPIEFVDSTIKHMVDHTDTLIMSIACKLAHHVGYDGKNLHCTVMTPEEWLSRISKYTVIQDYDIRDRSRLLVFTGKNYCKPDYVQTPEGLIRIRENMVGEVWIARSHRKTEQYLDIHYERLPGQLRWRPRGTHGRNMSELRPIFEGKPCYYIGKGPSLDRLTASQFTLDCPVIAINDSILKVESLNLKQKVFCLQGDYSFKDGSACQSPMFLQSSVSNFYPDVADKYIYYQDDLGVQAGPSVLHAMKIAERLGATRHILICFDAMTDKDCGYADCIGYGPEKGGNPKRFLGHRQKVTRYIPESKMTFITPDVLVSDTKLGTAASNAPATDAPATDATVPTAATDATVPTAVPGTAASNAPATDVTATDAVPSTASLNQTILASPSSDIAQQ